MTECKHDFEQDLCGRLICAKCKVYIEETQES